MAKRMILMLVVVLAVLGGIFGRWAYKGIKMGKAMAAQKIPPVAVATAVAQSDDWQPVVRAVGSVLAVQGVTITNELPGTVSKIDFASGETVKAGDLLVAQRTSTEQAQLDSAKAAVVLARQTLARAEQLRKTSANTQSDLDTAQAQYDQAVASAGALEATIAKKQLRAPFAGRLGIRQINLGQYLPAGSAVVNLESLNPIYVNFTLPQQALSKVVVGQTVAVTVDTFPGQKFTGKITAIDSRLDATSRSVQLQATLPNADEALKPGMFADVNVLLPQQDRVVTVPQAAITYNPYGDFVYVVEPAGAGKTGPQPLDAGGAQGGLVVRQQFVELGDTRGDQVAVLKGVKAGETVVTAGQLNLRNGAHVAVNNSVPIADNPAPNPPNT